MKPENIITLLKRLAPIGRLKRKDLQKFKDWNNMPTEVQNALHCMVSVLDANLSCIQQHLEDNESYGPWYRNQFETEKEFEQKIK